jgi:hypothetical protein
VRGAARGRGCGRWVEWCSFCVYTERGWSEGYCTLTSRIITQVFIDGGVRRGTDIFKALALGAKVRGYTRIFCCSTLCYSACAHCCVFRAIFNQAVGVGRPALYAMSAFGTEGVRRMVSICGENVAAVCPRLYIKQ